MNPKSILRLAVAGVLWAMIAIRLEAAELALQVLQEFFPGPGPSYPFSPLLEEADGSFLSTSRNGGDFDGGTVYRITRPSQVSVLHSFVYPYSFPQGLSRMPDGNLCGLVSTPNPLNVTKTIFKFTTNDWSFSEIGTSYTFFTAHPTFDGATSYFGPDYGGDHDLGQILRLTTNGSATSLFSFNGTNGTDANQVVIGKDGFLYGTTSGGGNGYAGSLGTGLGTVFKLSTNGVLTTLAYFDRTNGSRPQSPLTFGSDGWLYGTTRFGGTNGGFGTVFRVSTNGVLESLWSFDGTNGGWPAMMSGLVQALNGKFYGITAFGTVNTNTRYGYAGTVFSITTNAEMSLIARFNGTNMMQPAGTMTLARDGNLYGVLADEYVRPSLDGNTGIFVRLAQVPEITSVNRTNGVTRLEWTSFTNGVYHVQSRPTLAATNWTTVSSNLTATGDFHSFVLPASNTSQSYYRVALLP